MHIKGNSKFFSGVWENVVFAAQLSSVLEQGSRRDSGILLLLLEPNRPAFASSQRAHKSGQVSVKRPQVINCCGLSANLRSLHSQVTGGRCFLSLCQSVASFCSSLYLSFYSLIIFDLIPVMVGVKQQRLFNVHFYVTFPTGLALISGNSE